MRRKEGPRCDDASALPACSLSHPQLFRTTNHVAVQATAAGGPAQPRLAHKGGAGGAGSPLQRCNRERTSSAGRRAGWVGERAAGWLPGGCPRPAAAHPRPPWTWEPGRSAHAACCNPCLRCIGVEARWEPPKPHMSCRRPGQAPSRWGRPPRWQRSARRATQMGRPTAAPGARQVPGAQLHEP